MTSRTVFGRLLLVNGSPTSLVGAVFDPGTGIWARGRGWLLVGASTGLLATSAVRVGLQATARERLGRLIWLDN